MAGIPSNRIGLHSFCSAFYCNALANATNTNQNSENIKSLTQIIAGWQRPELQELYKKRELDNIQAINAGLDPESAKLYQK